jgi:hypothetical protein
VYQILGRFAQEYVFVHYDLEILIKVVWLAGRGNWSVELEPTEGGRVEGYTK